MDWHKNYGLVLFLILGVQTSGWGTSRFGVNFYDEADFAAKEYAFSSEALTTLPRIADQHFNSLRVITDLNEGDPSQKICACYQVNETTVAARQCGFEKGMVAHPDLQAILTIENPEKWLDSIDSAIAYVYQSVIPLAGTIAYPTDPQLQPNFWGVKPESWGAAGCVLSEKSKQQVHTIVVGLEVGAHLNPKASNFDHKIQQVNNLPTYVSNLIEVLTRFGIKQNIYVTTSLAPSNCDLAKDLCQNMYEALQLDNNQYLLNQSKQKVDVDGETKIIDFPQVSFALEKIQQQTYEGNAPGVLVSLYHYWLYDPNVPFNDLDPSQWAKQIGDYYQKIQTAFRKDEKLIKLPVSIGEIGWPALGNNECDHAPNKPNDETQNHLLQGIHQWGTESDAAPYIFIWRLFDVDKSLADTIFACGDQNPEAHYGLYPGALTQYVDDQNPKPRHADSFPNFKA